MNVLYSYRLISAVVQPEPLTHLSAQGIPNLPPPLTLYSIGEEHLSSSDLRLRLSLTLLHDIRSRVQRLP